jgi:hypothetical protein
MVLYVCLIPNRGARIGHQSSDYFNVLTWCNKNKFYFVYHPFTCNSHTFETALQFKRLHEYNYENTINIVDTVISIDYLVKLKTYQEIPILEQLIKLNNSNDKNYVI